MSKFDEAETAWINVCKAWDSVDLPEEPDWSEPDGNILLANLEHYCDKLRKQYTEVVKQCNINETAAQKASSNNVALQAELSQLRTKVQNMQNIIRIALDMGRVHD